MKPFYYSEDTFPQTEEEKCTKIPIFPIKKKPSSAKK